MTASPFIDLGVGPAGAAGFDLPILMRSGLLIQANSGGGKSRTLRRLAEQLSGKVQTLIFDPEGEFASLREHYPFVLVGKGGDTPADVRTAPAVIRKILGLGVSAVFDLFEMSDDERHAWVRAGLTAMIDAPKDLWHDVFVMLDEAHLFAPEKGSGESEASDAVAALASRGRKRGYCTAAATQRLAKFRKDVAAELQNKLIGSTFLPNDRDRAAEELGISRLERKLFDHQIKNLDPGQFWGFGRAISRDRILVRVGPVRSHHPEPGELKQGPPPPPPEKIRGLLAKLGDLPKEEPDGDDPKALRAEIGRLRAELATSPHRGEMVAQLAEDATALAAERDLLREQLAALEGATPIEVRRLRHMELFFERVIGAVDGYREAGGGKWARNAMVDPPSLPLPFDRTRPEMAAFVDSYRPPPAVDPPRRPDKTATAGLSKCARAILNVLAQRGAATDAQLSALSGYRSTSSTFANGLSELRVAGFMDGAPERRQVTTVGRKANGPIEPLPKGPALLAYWDRRLGKCERAMLDAIYRAGTITRAKLSERAGYRETSSTFANGISSLRMLDLVHGPNGGDLTIADVFTEAAR